MKARKTIISNVNDTGVKVDEIKIDTNFNWTTLRQSDPDKIIAGFFDISKNPIAISIYGDGQHNAPERIEAKVKLWGDRYANSNPLRCFVSEDKGYVNIGETKVKDNRNTENPRKVIEFGTFWTDDSFANQEGKGMISEALNDILVSYPQEAQKVGVLKKYSKVFGTLSKDHPYGREVLLNAGLHLVDADNVVKEFGENGLPSNRFTFDEFGVMETGRAVDLFVLDIGDI
jgi:hypothetical protein